eukprot:IDg5354t1
MSTFLAFTVQQKTNCLTLFIQTQSITQTQRNFRQAYGSTAPVRNSILRWVNNFNKTGKVEQRIGHGRPLSSAQVEQRITTYFN